MRGNRLPAATMRLAHQRTLPHKDVGIAFPTVPEGLPEETVPSASRFLANQLEAVGVACADDLLFRGHCI